MTDYILRDQSIQANAIEAIRALDLSKTWRVTIKPYVKKRTLDQNSLYWEWLTMIGDHIGDCKDEVHHHMGCKFLPMRSTTIRGLTTSKPISTTKLSTVEMSEYMDKIHAFATTELGIRLPVPEMAE